MYCMYCGKPTENGSMVCPECAAKGNAPCAALTRAEDCSRIPPNYSVSVPESRILTGGTSAPVGPSVYLPREGRPVDRCGKSGMIFSLVSVGCLLLMVVALFWASDMMDHFVDQSQGAGIVLGISYFMLLLGISALPLLLSGIFSAVGIVCSSIALARRERFRGVGFAVAGLVVGLVPVLVFLAAMLR